MTTTPSQPWMTAAVNRFPGNLFVFSAPSGAGKSTLVNALMQLDSHLQVSVSHTTRLPRGQEKNGREYHFVDSDAFESMVSHGDFLEWAKVHGNLYGTSRSAIESRLESGDDVVLEIDWQGALQVKKIFPESVLVFILPPSYEELLQRLNRRGEDADEVIETRMHNAKTEVAQACHFDFVVVNALFESALFDLKTIVHAQRLKYASQRRNKSVVFQALGMI